MEVETSSVPRAWVGCLGCYNSGKLVGAWCDREEADDLESVGLVREFVGELRNHFGCVVCGSGEFWCFDVEHLPTSREMSPSEFVRLAEREEKIEEHGDAEALRVFIEHMGFGPDFDFDEVVSQFEDAYRGDWSSVEEFAEEMAEEQGDLAEVPDHLASCIDWESYWNSWLRFDYWEQDGHFFRDL